MKRSFRSAVRGALPAAAAAVVALAAGPALAGTYVTGPLPSEFGGGFIPPNPAVLKNVQKANKESAKLAASVEKCYSKGALNYSKGKATGVDTCLNDVKKGVLPKFNAKIAKIVSKAPGLPPCHDFAADGALIATLVKGFNGLTYCDGAPDSCDQVVVTVSTDYAANNVAGVTTVVTYPETAIDIPGSGSDQSVVDRVTNLTGINNGLFNVGDQDTDSSLFDDTLAVGLISLGTPIPAGDFAEAIFDCVPEEPTPTEADFGCTLDASDIGGNTVSGTCSVTVVAIP